MRSEPGPECWTECFCALYDFTEVTTLWTTKQILDGYTDSAVERDWSGETFDPRTFTEMLHGSGAGVA